MFLDKQLSVGTFTVLFLYLKREKGKRKQGCRGMNGGEIESSSARDG